MTIQFFTNQFGQQVAVGDLDLGIFETGALPGILSANQSSPAVTVKAGAAAIIDSAITAGRVIQFKQGLYTDATVIGFFRRTAQKALFAIGDQVEVVLNGTVIWLPASGTIAPGAQVQNHTDSFGVVTASGGKIRGINLDYVTSGSLARVLITTPLAFQS